MALSPQQVHVDKALTNYSLAYRNASYCADRISPAVTVQFESDRYYVYGREAFRVPPSIRQDKAETREIGYSVSTEPYLCQEYGYHELVSDRERENSDTVLRPELDATEHLTETLMLDRELRVANHILDNTNPDWGDYAGTHFENLANAWDNLASADARGDFYHAKYVIFKDARKNATHVFIPTETGFQLAQLQQVDELRKYTDPSLLTNSGLPPKVWGLEVVECQSTYDTSAEGVTADYAETWGNNVVFAHINPNPMGLRTLTFSLTFQKRAFEVRKWRVEPRRSDVVECTHIYDDKIVAPACGFVYQNANTPS